MPDRIATTTNLPAAPGTGIISNKTRRLLRLLLIIALVMFVVVIVHVIMYRLTVWPIAGGLIVGAIVGVLLGRINRVSWDESSGSVVTQMDLFGAVLLVLYLVFAFSRGRVVGTWIDDAHTVSAVALALGAGSISGHVLHLLRGIRNTLVVAGILPRQGSRATVRRWRGR